MSKSLRKSDGTFAPGWRGGGRPPGARNKLTEIALQALGDDFAEHGKAAIEKVRREKTHVYLQIIASLMPRQLSVEKLSPFGELSDQEMDQLEQLLAAMRARTVGELEVNGTTLELELEPAKPQEK
jgi:hypothetical protein